MSPRLLCTSAVALLLLGGRAPAAPVTRSAPAAALVVELRGGELWLSTPGGEELVDLLPELWVAYAPPEVRPGALPSRIRGERLTWMAPRPATTADGWSLQVEAAKAGARYVLRLRGRAVTIELLLEARYERDVTVRQEVLRFRSRAAQVQTLDRAYRWTQPRSDLFVDALTPRVVRLAARGSRASELTLLGGEGVQGMWLRPAAAGAAIELELDHEGNHPFSPHRSCVVSPRQLVARAHLDGTLRRAGSQAQLRARWVAGNLTPPLVGRFPRAMAAALVLTDHADQSNAAKLEALAFGATGALARGDTSAGLVNHGLSYTKTIFLRRVRRYAAQFEDQSYRRLLDAMARRGVEIGVHSASGRRDRPPDLERLLAAFRVAFPGRVWIDHQPTTNCEAVTNQGWDAQSSWYLLPLLAVHDLRYLWSAQDVDPGPGSLNLLAPELPRVRRAVIYRAPRLDLPADGKRPRYEPVLFTSSRLFVERRAVLRRLSAAAIERLIAERGLYIGHVYLDTFQGRGRFRDRSLVARRGASQAEGYVLRPEIDALFARLAVRQAAGELWVAGIEAVAEHLRGALAVEAETLPGGRLRLSSRQSLRGLTLLLPSGVARVTVAGGAPDGERLRGGLREVWFDLPARTPTLVELRDRAGRPLELHHPTVIRYRDSASRERER
jgi:hypothetical protein